MLVCFIACQIDVGLHDTSQNKVWSAPRLLFPKHSDTALTFKNTPGGLASNANCFPRLCWVILCGFKTALLYRELTNSSCPARIKLCKWNFKSTRSGLVNYSRSKHLKREMCPDTVSVKVFIAPHWPRLQSARIKAEHDISFYATYWFYSFLTFNYLDTKCHSAYNGSLENHAWARSTGGGDS